MNFYKTHDYIRDEQQFLTITKQLAWMRGCSDILRLLHYRRKKYLITVKLLSVKTPRLIHNLGFMKKNMPAQGGNVLRMKRYEI